MPGACEGQPFQNIITRASLSRHESVACAPDRDPRSGAEGKLVLRPLGRCSGRHGCAWPMLPTVAGPLPRRLERCQPQAYWMPTTCLRLDPAEIEAR